VKKAVVYVGFLLSALFLWLALRNTSFTAISDAFAAAKWWPMIPMFLCLAGFYALKAARWSVLLSPAHSVTGTQLVPAMLVGAAGNNLLPAHMGEFVRVYFAGKKFAIPKSTVLATLIVERLFDFLTVIALLTSVFFMGSFSTELYTAGAFLVAVAITTTLACVLLVRYANRFVALARQYPRWLAQNLREKIARQFIHLSSGLQALRAGHLYLRVIVNSLLQWLLMAGCIYFALLAFDIGATMSTAIVILGLTVAGLTLPSSPGFFGTIEYCFVLGLASIGVEPSVALSAAIYYHIPVWIVVTLTGLTLARRNRFSLRKEYA